MPTKVDTRLSYLSPNILLIISGVFLGAICTFSSWPYLNLVKQLGLRIPQDDMVTDYVTSLAWATFLGACIIFSPVRHKDKNMLLVAWIIKCFVSLVLLLFYESHYPSDAEGYWVGTKELSFGYLHEFFKPGAESQFLTLLLLSYKSAVPYFLQNSYHSLKVTFSMMGLIAMYLFYRSSNIITKRENRMFFWVLVLFPSLLIYCSRIGKAPYMVFTIALYTAGLVNWHFKRKIIYLFIGLISLLACTIARPWVGGLLVVPLFFYFLYANKNFFSKGACALLVGLLIFPTYELLLIKFDLKSFDEIYNKLAFVANTQGGGGSNINRADIVVNGPLDVIKHAPSGIFTALFRPLPWDVPGLLGFLSGMEGLLLLYLFIRAVIRTRLRELNDPIVVWAIVAVLSWALIYGFAIQNFGTAIRYRAQILPIFLGLLCYLGRSRDPNPIVSKALNHPVLNQ